MRRIITLTETNKNKLEKTIIEQERRIKELEADNIKFLRVIKTQEYHLQTVLFSIRDYMDTPVERGIITE